MADQTVVPVSGNNCKGKFKNGDADIRFKCVKKLDESGDPVFTCSTFRYFRVSCPKINKQCSSLSGAYVAAVTVCNQKLF